MAKATTKTANTKTVKTSAARIALLGNITHTAFAAGMNDRHLSTMLNSAGTDQKDVRRAAMLGHMAATFATKTDVKTGVGDNAEAKLVGRAETAFDKPDAKRTATERNAFNSAKMAWSRWIKKQGVKSDHGNAGNKSASSKTKTAKTAAPAAPVTPAAATRTDVDKYLGTQAIALMAYIEKNKAVAGDYAAAVNAFAKAVSAVAANREKAGKAKA